MVARSVPSLAARESKVETLRASKRVSIAERRPAPGDRMVTGSAPALYA